MSLRQFVVIALLAGLMSAALPTSAPAHQSSATHIEMSPLPSGVSNVGPITVTPGHSRDVWFIAGRSESGLASTAIGHMNPRGRIAEFPIPGINATAIAITPGGSVWFNDEYAPKLWRISKSGELKAYALPNDEGWVRDIAIGPGGSVWFTEMGGFEAGGFAPPRVGRISQDGRIVEYPLPGGELVGGISPGPGGDMWFIQYSSLGGRGGLGHMASIDRITPKGKVTRNSFLAIGDLFDIAAGPDGNLWFPETGGIGRMTPKGRLRRFSVPAVSRGRNLSPATIVSGPRRSLWFTGLGPGLIGRITTRGRVEKFRVPVPWSPPQPNEEHRGLVAGLTPAMHGGLAFTEIGQRAECGRRGCTSEESTGYVGRVPAARLADRYSD